MLPELMPALQVLQIVGATTFGTVISEILVILLIALVLLLVFKIGGGIIKFFFGIIANSVLGVISIFVLNFFLKIGIPIKLYTLVIAAVFGLPGVGTLVILRFFSVVLP